MLPFTLLLSLPLLALASRNPSISPPPSHQLKLVARQDPSGVPAGCIDFYNLVDSCTSALPEEELESLLSEDEPPASESPSSGTCFLPEHALFLSRTKNEIKEGKLELTPFSFPLPFAFPRSFLQTHASAPNPSSPPALPAEAPSLQPQLQVGWILLCSSLSLINSNKPASPLASPSSRPKRTQDSSPSPPSRVPSTTEWTIRAQRANRCFRFRCKRLRSPSLGTRS
ncbi:hypothetical protein BDY24DRAFT_382492 [Mrakia frigida]|uniref:uncharacterized protein n=1 Tax=Mrakia frigida TaxID=29902 RepID=UPI003FCC16C3